MCTAISLVHIYDCIKTVYQTAGLGAGPSWPSWEVLHMKATVTVSHTFKAADFTQKPDACSLWPLPQFLCVPPFVYGYCRFGRTCIEVKVSLRLSRAWALSGKAER